MPDSLRSSHEDKLISLSKQYQSAYVGKDLNKLDELLSPKVVYHADKVRLFDWCMHDTRVSLKLTPTCIFLMMLIPDKYE